jgi:hypothetical protein
MTHEVFVLLWTDDDGLAQCAVYEDREDAERDAPLVGGRVEVRQAFATTRERTGRFDR